jgi:hypothetical protein
MIATIAPLDLLLPDSAPILGLSGRPKGGKIEAGSAQLLAQDVLLDFSESVSRQLVDEVNPTRLLVAG